MKNTIDRSRGTLGVRLMPDELDSGGCHVRCIAYATVRVNLNGVWTSMCDEHLRMFREMLDNPLPAPQTGE